MYFYIDRRKVVVVGALGNPFAGARLSPGLYYASRVNRLSVRVCVCQHDGKMISSYGVRTIVKIFLPVALWVTRVTCIINDDAYRYALLAFVSNGFIFSKKKTTRPTVVP